MLVTENCTATRQDAAEPKLNGVRRLTPVRSSSILTAFSATNEPSGALALYTVLNMDNAKLMYKYNLAMTTKNVPEGSFPDLFELLKLVQGWERREYERRRRVGQRSPVLNPLRCCCSLLISHYYYRRDDVGEQRSETRSSR